MADELITLHGVTVINTLKFEGKRQKFVVNRAGALIPIYLENLSEEVMAEARSLQKYEVVDLTTVPVHWEKKERVGHPASSGVKHYLHSISRRS